MAIFKLIDGFGKEYYGKNHLIIDQKKYLSLWLTDEFTEWLDENHIEIPPVIREVVATEYNDRRATIPTLTFNILDELITILILKFDPYGEIIYGKN
jgi:hypothetical protein